MSAITDLWLPILVSGVGVFFASFLAWMVLPHHKGDFKQFKSEGAVLDALRPQGLAPGTYIYPDCQGPAMKTEEGKQRYAAGPWGVILVHGGPANFGRNLVLVFAFYVVVSVLVAYVARLALPDGASFMNVFRIAGTAGAMAYALGGIPNAIFFGRTGRSIAMDTLDGVAFGLLTGAIFGWFWPGTAA